MSIGPTPSCRARRLPRRRWQSGTLRTIAKGEHETGTSDTAATSNPAQLGREAAARGSLVKPDDVRTSIRSLLSRGPPACGRRMSRPRRRLRRTRRMGCAVYWKRTIVVLLLATLSVLAPRSAQAILYREPDNGEHPNVGSLVGQSTNPETGATEHWQLCTGTLIDEDVVLTASHCIVGLEEFGVEDANPFVRYGPRLAWWGFARTHGMTEAACVALTRELADGFEITPFAHSPLVSSGCGANASIKDETGNVGGSHKGRHLVTILLHLVAAEALGLAPYRDRPPLADRVVRQRRHRCRDVGPTGRVGARRVRTDVGVAAGARGVGRSGGVGAPVPRAATATRRAIRPCCGSVRRWPPARCRSACRGRRTRCAWTAGARSAGSSPTRGWRSIGCSSRSAAVRSPRAPAGGSVPAFAWTPSSRRAAPRSSARSRRRRGANRRQCANGGRR